MGTLELSGSITGGPPVASDVFPGSRIICPLKMRSNPKSFGAATGVLMQRINSPSPAYVTLAGLGASGPVTRADFLYLRSDSTITLRYTHDDGAGGSTLVVLPSHGLVVLEFQDTKFLKLLEAQGSALIEYLVCGPQ